jgi:hypothetical protein
MDDIASGKREGELASLIAEQLYTQLIDSWVNETWMNELALTCVKGMTIILEKQAEVQATPERANILVPLDYVTETFTPAIHSPAAYTPLDTIDSPYLPSAAQTESDIFMMKTFDFASESALSGKDSYSF